MVRRDLQSEIGLKPAGSDGVVCARIERIKGDAGKIPELGLLYGRGTQGSLRYLDPVIRYAGPISPPQLL